LKAGHIVSVLALAVTLMMGDASPCIAQSSCTSGCRSVGNTPGTVQFTPDANGNLQSSATSGLQHCQEWNACTKTWGPTQYVVINYSRYSDGVVRPTNDPSTWYRKAIFRGTAFCGSGWGCGSYTTYIEGTTTVRDRKTWSVSGAISGGGLTAPANGVATVAPGETLNCGVGLATDTDSWSQGAWGSGTEADTVTYLWSGPPGGVFSSPSGQSTSWTAPQTAGTYTLTCTIDDAGIVPPSDLGTRNDPSAGRPVTVTVDYPSVNFTGLPRACAGAINDNTHKFTLQVEAKLGQNRIPNTAFTFSFDTTGINYTGLKPPMFINDQGLPVPTLIKTTDGNGNFTSTDANGNVVPNNNVTVLSSDLISQPQMVATGPWTDAQGNPVRLGSVTSDFGAAQSKRRYGIKDLNQGYGTDEGWNFNDLLMQEEGDTTDATVYLKFRKDSDDMRRPIDQNYFLIGGMPKASLDSGDGAGGDPNGWVDDDEYAAGQIRGITPYQLLSDHDNWLPVKEHQVRIKIAEIVDIDYGPVDPSDFAQYVVFDENGGNVISATTDANGKATVRLKAGPWIYYCYKITLQAINLTQKSWSGVNASSGW